MGRLRQRWTGKWMRMAVGRQAGGWESGGFGLGGGTLEWEEEYGGACHSTHVLTDHLADVDGTPERRFGCWQSIGIWRVIPDP